MQEFLINHWEALSSLLLSVVTITIAIISARSTAKQSMKMIQSSEENVDKNVQGIKQMVEDYIKQSKSSLKSMKILACATIENTIITIDSNINKLEFEKHELEANPCMKFIRKDKTDNSSNNNLNSIEIDEKEMYEYNMYKIDNIKEHISNLRVLREELLDILVSIDEDEKYRSKRRGFRDYYWYYYR